jgi:hypothetical protein
METTIFYKWGNGLWSIRQIDAPEGYVVLRPENMLASRTYVFSKLLKKVELKDLPLYLDREYKSEEFMRLFGATSSF